MSALMGGIERPFSRLSDRVGGAAILGQRFVVPRASAANTDLVETIPIPEGAYFVFAEILAPGNAGRFSAGDGATGGGGGASDAILPVGASTKIVVTIPDAYKSINGDVTATVSLDDVVALSVTSGLSARATQGGAGGTGKYPGTSGSRNSPGLGGQGGGRLAGRVGVVGNQRPSGPGCGGIYAGANGTYFGGEGQAMLTFFGDYESALAFAKSVYGGTWTP